MIFIETLLWSINSLILLFYLIYYFLNIHESKKPNNIQKHEVFPKVSLIIPTYNEEKTILRKLENITEMDYPKNLIEVLVVDSGSSDGTQKIVEEFLRQNRSEIDFRLIYQQHRMGKACAINFSLQHSHGEIVILSDADATFEIDAVAKIVENFADPVVGAVTGKLVILNAAQSSITKLEKNYRSFFDILRLGESNMDSTPVFNGPIMAFRRNLIDKLNSETIADDTEMSMSIRKKGWKAIYAPEAIAYEYTPVTFNSRFKQKVRRAHGIIQSFVRHKDFLFNAKYGRYGLTIFPCEFFMHIVSPVLILLSLMLIIATILVNPVVAIYFSLATLSLLVLSGLVMFVRKIVTKGESTIMNPFSLLSTFLNHQFCLLIGLCLFVLRKSNYEWEKIDDVRNHCEKVVRES